MKYFNNYYNLSMSPWPIVISFVTMNFFLAMIFLFLKKLFFLMSSIFLMISLMYKWWNTIEMECFFKGLSNSFCFSSMKMGMIFFIVSELLFFFSFFWSYFHSSLSLDFFLGEMWPPVFFTKINSFNIPLLNSLLLLSSGISITWSHNELYKKNFFFLKNSFFLTIFLGIIFILFQMYEYMNNMFLFFDSCYGNLFFLMTGFHGLHVLVGVTFLLVNFYRFITLKFNYENFNSFEFSIWYWHFVDVVWLFLYFFIYF